MRGTRNTDRNVRKFITINDLHIWNRIDEIMSLPEYSKSFNKVINDALFYGIETLYNELFKKQPVVENEKQQNVTQENELIYQIIRLLKEMIINETLNKSILCSLFQVKNLELHHQVVSGERFKEGYYRDTPDYLIQYELKSLKDLRK